MTMNKCFLLLLCSFLMLACTEDDVEPSIVISSSENTTIEATSGSYTTITFISTLAWTASVDVDWLSCSPVSGEGGTSTVTLVCTESNGTGATRTATLTLASGSVSKSVTITQEDTEHVTLEQDTYTVTADGGMLVVNFTTNVDTDYLKIYGSSGSSSSLSWIQSMTRADVDYYVALNVSANTDASSRTAYLYFYKETTTERTLLATATIIQEGTSSGTSTDYSNDKTVVTLQEATKGNGIPIVLMGDGFIDTEIADGTYETVMKKAMENLFSEEPMTSLQDYFDVYYVVAVSANNIFANGYSTAFSCTLSSSSSHVEGDDEAVQTYAQCVEGIDLDQTLAVVILNTNDYGGTTYFGYYRSSTQTMTEFAIAYCPIIYGLDNEYFRTVVVHEAAGHGFAKLDDEYSYAAYGAIPDSEKSTIQNFQTNYGWYMNVDFTTDTSEVLWADFLSDTRYSSEGLGIYEGAASYITGVYRPSEASMMNQNDCGFNAPSRKEIYDRVMEDGAGVEPTYEEFVTFDMSTTYSNGLFSKNLRSQSEISESGKRFHAPQFVGKSLSVSSSSPTE